MKKFAMSMYPNELALFKAKAEYFEKIYNEADIETDRLYKEVESLSEIIEWSGVDVGEILAIMKNE